MGADQWEYSGNWVPTERRTARAGKRPDSAAIADPAQFARERLQFEPDAMQTAALRGGRRGIVLCTRQWGKSTVMAAKAVHRAYRKRSLVLVLAPSARQSAEFLRKAGDFVRLLGIKVRGDGSNELSIALPNGSRIVGLPENEDKVRGFSNVSLLLIDEAARVSDELYRAMRPTLAVGDGDLWLMSTPNGQRGFFYEEWKNGGEEWARIQVTGPDCPRISARFLAEEKAREGEKWFRQEYLCEFVERDGQVFSQESIDAAMQDFEPLFL